MTKIMILTGTTRPARFNDQPAQWIRDIAQKRSDIEVDYVDLAELNLPFLDEPVPPSQGKYQNEHSKQWAARVGAADGYIMVTPEYNHSYAPALKNAIDYVFAEWNYKPVSFISYGSMAGGARAVEHLRGIAGELKMYDLREQILLPNYWENLDAKGKYQFTDRHAESANQMLDNVTFWANELKGSRGRLPS